MKQTLCRARGVAAMAVCLSMLLGAAGAEAGVFNLSNWAGIPAEVETRMRALESEKGAFVTWSLEDKAMSETLGLEEGLAIALPDYTNVLPGEDAVPQEEAWGAALERLAERYIITEDMLADFDVYPSYIRMGDGSGERWAFDVRPVRGASQRGRYRVEVDAATGEAIESRWDIYEFWSYAAALAEQKKADALLEHMDEYDFGLLPAADKAMYSDILREAGHTEYFYAVPDAADVEEAEAVAIAIAAVEEKYGLTAELIDAHVDTLVSFLVVPDGGRFWRIQFQPMPYRDTYGLYTVDVASPGAEVTDVLWTYDGVEPDAAPEDLNARFLGVEQLKKLWALEEEQQALTAEMEAELGPMDRWSLEDKATYSKIWLENGHPKEDMILFGLPGEGDISEAEAIAMARDMINEKYGPGDAVLDECDVYTTFSLMPYGNNPEWEIWFIPKTQVAQRGEYLVQFTSPNGTLILCNWYVENFWLHVDELAARGKLDAVNERIELAEFSALPGDERAEVIDLLLEAGYEPASREGMHTEPGEGAITPDEAIDIAAKAIGAKYGLTEEVLARYFADGANHVVLRKTGEATWLVDFAATRYVGQLGSYSARVPASGGMANAVAWSLEDMNAEQDDGGATLGTKHCWGKAELARLEALNEESNALIATFAEARRWTDEEKAALSDIWAAEDIDPFDPWYTATPTGNDMTRDEAIAAATEAVRTAHEIDEARWQGYAADETLYAVTPDVCQWVVTFIHEDLAIEESFAVFIASDTDEVLAVEHHERAVG